MVDVMADYRHLHPGIDFHVVNATSTEMATAVLSGGLDIAVVGLGPEQLPDGLGHRSLGSDPLVVIVPRDHDLADREAIDLSELPPTHQLIQFTEGTGLRRHVEAAFIRAGVEPGRHFEVGQVHDMIRLAARGVGVTVVPRSAVRGPGAFLGPCATLPADARVLSLTDAAAVHQLTVIFDNGRLSPAATAFLDVIDRHTQRH
jgi:DNA-binding transcriptional LysR family regulator